MSDSASIRAKAAAFDDLFRKHFPRSGDTWLAAWGPIWRATLRPRCSPSPSLGERRSIRPTRTLVRGCSGSRRTCSGTITVANAGSFGRSLARASIPSCPTCPGNRMRGWMPSVSGRSSRPASLRFGERIATCCSSSPGPPCPTKRSARLSGSRSERSSHACLGARRGLREHLDPSGQVQSVTIEMERRHERHRAGGAIPTRARRARRAHRSRSP